METNGKNLSETTAAFDEEPLCQQTMNNVLENRARELGSRTYINYGPEGRAVSFEEMNEAANSIGRGLVDLGVERADKVSVMLRHPLETLFAMFGIHKAGGVYSPINFEYKGTALSYQLNDTAPRVLFIEDQYVTRLNSVKDNLDRLPHIVVFETDAETESLHETFERTSLASLRDSPSSKPDVEVSWRDEASVVYTSGTTGKPKGVVLPHRWIFANYTMFFGQVLNEDDVVHTSLPLYHVGGVYADVVAALVSGSSVALWDQFSPNEFWDRIEMYGATKTILLSVMVPWLMKQGESPDDHRNPLKMVHMQPLPDSYDEMAERFGFDVVTAGFGQTEAGVPLAGAIHANPDGTPKKLLSGMRPDEILSTAEELGLPVVENIEKDRYMGQPTQFMEAAILDDNDERLPPGAAGELAFRPKRAGIILKEYYNKPEKTLDAFSNLWFHTGDAAYQDEDGNFYFIDRLGDVIRRRGENISSMQIQDTLNAHNGVSQAAVFAIPAEEGGEDLIGAAVEPLDIEEFSESALNEYLDDALPSFMHPDRLAVVDEVPTTETNKIEKYKLREQLIEE
jgi:crotonobetaine/carnitine-CoA ligase